MSPVVIVIGGSAATSPPPLQLASGKAANIPGEPRADIRTARPPRWQSERPECGMIGRHLRKAARTQPKSSTNGGWWRADGLRYIRLAGSMKRLAGCDPGQFAAQAKKFRSGHVRANSALLPGPKAISGARIHSQRHAAAGGHQPQRFAVSGPCPEDPKIVGSDWLKLQQAASGQDGGRGRRRDGRRWIFGTRAVSDGAARSHHHAPTKTPLGIGRERSPFKLCEVCKAPGREDQVPILRPLVHPSVMRDYRGTGSCLESARACKQSERFTVPPKPRGLSAGKFSSGRPTT